MIIAEFVGGHICGKVSNVEIGTGVVEFARRQDRRPIRYYRHRFKNNRWIFVHESIHKYLAQELK